MARRSGRPGPTSASWPTNSSSVRGRMRSASGAGALDAGSRGLVVKQRHWTLATCRWRRHAAARPRRGPARRRPRRSAIPPARCIGMVSALVGRGDDGCGQAGTFAAEQDRAVGREGRTRAAACRRAAVVAMTRSPAVRAPRAIAASSGCRPAIGMRNVLPIAPRSAFQPNGSARAVVTDDPRRAASLRRANDRADVSRILHSFTSGPARDVARSTCSRVGARTPGDRRHARAADRTGLIAPSTGVGHDDDPGAATFEVECDSLERPFSGSVNARTSTSRPDASASSTRWSPSSSIHSPADRQPRPRGTASPARSADSRCVPSRRLYRATRAVD